MTGNEGHVLCPSLSASSQKHLIDLIGPLCIVNLVVKLDLVWLQYKIHDSKVHDS